MLKLLGALFAAGKLGKVALTGGTMIISVFAYALIFGWWYAVGFVLPGQVSRGDVARRPRDAATHSTLIT